jgi:hypothetical protein
MEVRWTIASVNHDFDDQTGVRRVARWIWVWNAALSAALGCASRGFEASQGRGAAGLDRRGGGVGGGGGARGAALIDPRRGAGGATCGSDQEVGGVAVGGTWLMGGGGASMFGH